MSRFTIEIDDEDRQGAPGRPWQAAAFDTEDEGDDGGLIAAGVGTTPLEAVIDLLNDETFRAATISDEAYVETPPPPPVTLPAGVLAPSPEDRGPCAECHHDAMGHWTSAVVGGCEADGCTCDGYLAPEATSGACETCGYAFHVDPVYGQLAHDNAELDANHAPVRA